MNRTILFRAKDINSKDWIYGIPSYDFRFIFSQDNTDSFDNYKVLPDTTCEHIGVSNKSGLVFENDIIETLFGIGHIFYDINHCAYRVKWVKTILEVDTSWLPCKGFKKSRTIGNSIDNPKLLDSF